MERPEEKKNNQVVEKITDKLLNPITEAQGISRKLTNEFYQVSLRVASMNKKQQEVLGKLETTQQSIGNKIKRAYDKMKLGKKKNIRWQFDGKNSFIGTPIPEPKPKPKKEEK